MRSLYKEKFTIEEHDDFRNELLKNVHNSEKLEIFREKLFKKLVKLKIRKVKEKQRNY
jgi:hypothetical protein